MLERLHLKNVGPAPEMTMELAPRLNLITGDNGLGKSFLLDVAFWALTRRWPQELNRRLTSGYMAQPSERTRPASIELSLTSKSRSVSYESHYSPRDEAWTGKAGRPWNPGLVLYAHADGGFSVWDPARNYWRTKGNVDVQERLPAFVFSPKEVWDGLEVDIEGKTTVVCNGLIRDWAAWIAGGGETAARMTAALHALSPQEGPGDLLEPGPLTRLSLDDARDIPSLRSSHGDPIPILHASSGVRRIVALAYMLLWSWNEHVLAAKRLGESPTGQVVMLIDEIESHLHPRWQRTILRSVLGLVEILHPEATIQLLAVTHSPMILASAEPIFDVERDALFHLDKRDGRIALHEEEWAKQGDVTNWLVSEVFGLEQARSREAERAIEAAEAFMRGEMSALPADLHTRAEIHGALKNLLAPHDDFWPRWLVESGALKPGKPKNKGRAR